MTSRPRQRHPPPTPAVRGNHPAGQRHVITNTGSTP